jgi:hypothetical protein
LNSRRKVYVAEKVVEWIKKNGPQFNVQKISQIQGQIEGGTSAYGMTNRSGVKCDGNRDELQHGLLNKRLLY